MDQTLARQLGSYERCYALFAYAFYEQYRYIDGAEVEDALQDFVRTNRLPTYVSSYIRRMN